MANNEIWHRVEIKASPGARYQALTDVKKLAQWWIHDTRGESKTGKTLEFWFGEHLPSLASNLTQNRSTCAMGSN
jgi:uncharacterized protein YndB with AHSA1/START domain